jgi:hypothetical protein
MRRAELRSGAHINARNVIGRLCFFKKLLAGGFRFRLRLRRRHFFLEIRGAFLALIRLCVPANFRASPFAATRTLVKMLFPFFDRGF